MIAVAMPFHALLLCLLSALVACNGQSSANLPTILHKGNANLPRPAPEIGILVIGQSIASNCNEKTYGSSPNIFQVSLTGEIREAIDPFEWAGCKRGSMWIPLGRLLIDSGMASKVIFMPIGIGGTSVADWQAGGRAYSKLNAAIDVINLRNIHLQYAFWYQGSSDFGTKRDVYAARLRSVIAYVNKRIHIDQWLISIHSRCFGTWDKEIEAAQLDVVSISDDKIFLGPDSNLLGNNYRFDTCHFNSSGQETMARLWFESMKSVK